MNQPQFKQTCFVADGLRNGNTGVRNQSSNVLAIGNTDACFASERSRRWTATESNGDLVVAFITTLSSSPSYLIIIIIIINNLSIAITVTSSITMATRHLVTLTRRTLTATISSSTAVTNNFLKYNSPNPNPKSTDHTSILTCHQTRVTTLPNGLRVATEWNLSHTATVCLCVDTGSRFETRETNGVAYFLKNMLLRGTLKRCRSDLDQELENMGCELNGYTEREHTVFVAKVMMAGDVLKVIEIMSDMLQNSSFDEEVIVDTRNDILTRMLELNADQDIVICERLLAAAFQPGPLGWTVLGPPRNIMDMTKKDLQDYLSTHYAAHRMVISASGAVNHEEIVEQVDKMFTKLSTNPITSTQLVEKEPATFSGSEIRKRDDDMPLAHFGIVFKGASWTDPDSVALLIMRTMLGSWNKATDVGQHKGSQLAQMVGIDELAEDMRAVTDYYKETGLFGVYAAAKPDCLDDLASAIMQEISKLCYQVTEEDVVRAQNEVKTLFCKEQPTAWEIGRQLLVYGRRVPLAELFARVDAVDVATVKHVANKYIFKKDIAIAASGPVELLPDYNWFRCRTSMRC